MQENTDLHIGLAIRQHLEKQGTSIAWLARQVNCDRGSLWRQLHNAHIYPELLLKISTVLQTDFFALYSTYLSFHKTHIVMPKQQQMMPKQQQEIACKSNK